MFAAEVETIEDGIKTAGRIAKHGVEDLRGLKEDVVHGVKKQPLESVAAAFGVGLIVGAAVGWIAHRPR